MSIPPSTTCCQWQPFPHGSESLFVLMSGCGGCPYRALAREQEGSIPHPVDTMGTELYIGNCPQLVYIVSSQIGSWDILRGRTGAKPEANAQMRVVAVVVVLNA